MIWIMNLQQQFKMPNNDSYYDQIQQNTTKQSITGKSFSIRQLYSYLPHNKTLNLKKEVHSVRDVIILTL